MTLENRVMKPFRLLLLVPFLLATRVACGGYFDSCHNCELIQDGDAQILLLCACDVKKGGRPETAVDLNLRVGNSWGQIVWDR